MQLSSVILVGPLRDHYWAIQTYVYHCSPTCRSQRGDWDCHIHRNDLAPPSHKHITAWTTDSWPVSLNTSNTCTHAAINQCCTGIQKSVFSVKSLMFRKFWCETKKGKWKNRLIVLTDKEKKIENRAKPEETRRNTSKDGRSLSTLSNDCASHSETKNIYLNHHEMEKICIINVCMYKRWKVTGELHLANVCRVFIVVQAVLSSCQHFALPKALGLHRSWWLSVRKRGNLNTQTGNWGIIKCILDVNLSPQSSR